MTEIAGYKVLTRFSGSIEYIFEYRNPLLSGHPPGEEHFETERFENVGELVKLLSPDFLDTLKHAHAADGVSVAAVYMNGRNDEWDGAMIHVDNDGFKGTSSAVVTSDVIDSKATHYLLKLQGQMETMLKSIKQFQK